MAGSTTARIPLATTGVAHTGFTARRQMMGHELPPFAVSLKPRLSRPPSGRPLAASTRGMAVYASDRRQTTGEGVIGKEFRRGASR
jgi:hypothetical protein